MQGQGDRIIRIFIAAIILAIIGWIVLWWPAYKAESDYRQQLDRESRDAHPR